MVFRQLAIYAYLKSAQALCAAAHRIRLLAVFLELLSTDGRGRSRA